MKCIDNPQLEKIHLEIALIAKPENLIINYIIKQKKIKTLPQSTSSFLASSERFVSVYTSLKYTSPPS